MESINLNQSIAKNADFIQHVGEESGQPVQKCYQCGKCTAGCPVAFAMDYTPHGPTRNERRITAEQHDLDLRLLLHLFNPLPVQRRNNPCYGNLKNYGGE